MLLRLKGIINWLAREINAIRKGEVSMKEIIQRLDEVDVLIRKEMQDAKRTTMAVGSYNRQTTLYSVRNMLQQAITKLLECD